MKSKSVPLMALFIGILMSSLSLVPLANAQTDQGARFVNIKVIHYRPDNNDIYSKTELINGGTARVYDSNNVDISFVVYNENLFPTNLNTKTYIDNVLQRSDNITAPKTENTTFAWSTTLFGPVTQHWKVELWWENNLEDVKEFDVWVVKLFVENWSPASLTVEKGKIAPSSWSISFKNGGNDEMDNVSISIVDLAELQITPTSQNLGNVIAGGTSPTSFSVTAPFTLPTGQRTVKFQVTYYDFMGIPHTENMSASVNVDRLSTSIILGVTPSRVKKGDPCTITAQLVDGNGSPIANQEISFFVEMTSIGSVNTDPSGYAVKPYTANLDAGSYAINASFAETVDYKQSSATANLIVPFKTTLVLDAPSSAMVGDIVKIMATLKDEENRPLENMDVVFQINGNSIGDNKTNSSGIASIEYKPSTAGTFKVQAIFAETTNYENSSSQVAELVVGESIALKLGITVAVVAVVIVALLFFAKKRGMKIPFIGRKEEISPPLNPEDA